MERRLRWSAACLLWAAGLAAAPLARARAGAPVHVDGQPLGANVLRVMEALEYLGRPLPSGLQADLRGAAARRDAGAIQRLLDPRVLVSVQINPEARVKAARGAAPALLSQGGYTPVLVKVLNESTVTQRLGISSPQSGPLYAGVAELSMQRQQQPQLRVNENRGRDLNRFLQTEFYTAAPMTATLSGLEVEYRIALLYSRESGRREATLSFDLERGNQDLGFRAEVPILFQIRSARAVKLDIRDVDGKPAMARLTIRDSAGHIYPSQVKRLAPDFFFQPHIYRRHGETLLLPVGRYRVEFSRGPEYLSVRRELTVPEKGPAAWSLALKRWVDSRAYGYYAGDHHIHAAGCAHYQSPTEGVTPADMLRQVDGEGLSVGCVLTWGPCFEYQRRFFSPTADALSRPGVLLKYDLEISGFGSQALGHVCLLNLKDQVYPGSDGTKEKGWPSWTTPVMKWARSQGAVTGYAHSASGLHIDTELSTRRILELWDADRDGSLNDGEARAAFLPLPFSRIDTDRDRRLSRAELLAAHEAASDELPNLAIPEMNGVGAQEVCVTTAHGLCDFISAMDSARIPEWNCWYHILNSGFPLKVSGETDFPCMSSTRVGQGRVYVRLPGGAPLTYDRWVRGIKEGRSYVSDGFVHALAFEVEGKAAGDTANIASPGQVTVTATVAVAPEIPKTVAQGEVVPRTGLRVVGDTVLLHTDRTEAVVVGGEKRIEVVCNGQVVASATVPADGKPHPLRFAVPVERSSWIALRQFPQMHTNPVDVLVGGRPIRASASSARWCAETIRQLWRARSRGIRAAERDEAETTFNSAIQIYEARAKEAEGAFTVVR